MIEQLPLSSDLPPSESVRGFVGRVRAILKEKLGGDQVLRGIVSGFRGSGFFELQDETDTRLSISCSYYGNERVFDTLTAAGFPPQDGLPIMLRGRITLSNARSQIRFTVESVVPQYTRAILKSKRDETNERLAKEGLFEAQSKLKFPLLPRTLGFVTSERGVVFNDVIKALSAARYPFRYVWVRCGVQGPDAVRDIPQAIAELAAHPEVEVICVFRGGGSAMELDAFNSYEVARAVCISPKPVLCAIGHKPDECSAQDASFRNCHTPSLMGEFIVKRIEGLRQRVEMWTGVTAKKLREAQTLAAKTTQFTVGLSRERISALVHERRAQLRVLASAVPQRCRGLVERETHGLRLTASRIPRGMHRVCGDCANEVARRANRIGLQSRAAIRDARRRTADLATRVPPRVHATLHRARAGLERSRSWIPRALAVGKAAASQTAVLVARLSACDPVQQLKRGFAIVRAADGAVITRAADLDRCSVATLQMQDGIRTVTPTPALLS